MERHWLNNFLLQARSACLRRLPTGRQAWKSWRARPRFRAYGRNCSGCDGRPRIDRPGRQPLPQWRGGSDISCRQGRSRSAARPAFLKQHQLSALGKACDAVRSGEGQAQFGKFDREQQQIFSAGVEALSAPVAASLAATYDFSGHKRLLDVGGGTCSFLLAVLRRYPALLGTLFRCRELASSHGSDCRRSRRGHASISSRAICLRRRFPPTTMFCLLRTRSTCSRRSTTRRTPIPHLARKLQVAQLGVHID